jgi:hypothetical protein
MALKVNELSEAVKAMIPGWDKIDALCGGTDAMRLAGQKYMPQYPAEADDSYSFRLATSTLFNGLGRTVKNMAAKPFAKPATFTEVEPAQAEWFQNVDLCGNNLTVFAYNVMMAGLKYGLTHMLVEFPSTVDDQGNSAYPTRAAELAAGVRPYLVHVTPKQILGWKSEKNAAGAEVLSMLRLMETVEENDGDFGTKCVDQVRVLTPGRWATYRNAGQSGWALSGQGPVSLDFIPLVTFYTRRTGFMTAAAPFDDLADLNIKHWQSSSDQDSILHTARVPLLTISGVSEGSDKIIIGAKHAVELPLGAEMKFVEHSGLAIEAGRQSLLDLENQMRAMGAELLVESQVSTTATQNNIEDGEAKCQLEMMTEALTDALDLAVEIEHKMVKLEYKGAINLYKDFGSSTLMTTAGPFVLALVQLVTNGLLSKEDAFSEMQRYGIVNPDLVWEDVQGRIDIEPPAFTVPPVKTAPAVADE